MYSNQFPSFFWESKADVKIYTHTLCFVACSRHKRGGEARALAEQVKEAGPKKPSEVNAFLCWFFWVITEVTQENQRSLHPKFIFLFFFGKWRLWGLAGSTGLHQRSQSSCCPHAWGASRRKKSDFFAMYKRLGQWLGPHPGSKNCNWIV